MKKILLFIVLLTAFIVSFIYREEISDYVMEVFADHTRKVTELDNNKYADHTDYKFVQLTNDFYPECKDDIVNIYYTIINSGMTDFTFYCSKDYKECLDDVNIVSNDQKLLSHLNNFAPVFNNFKNIETEFDNLGKVEVHITHNYTDDEIKEINDKLDQVLSEIIKDDMKDEIKIKTFHDYLINNTKYDSNKSDNKDDRYHSDTAYGALIEGYAVCGGYADSMKLFLDRYNIPNFKISSENHIWNVAYVKDKWLHIDSTWDDPVTSSGEDILDYTYFLISTDELLNQEKEQHGFDLNIYQELNNN